MGRGRERMGEKIQGLRSINGRYETDEDVKASTGNAEAKQLICMTHGHELRGRMLKGREVLGG